MPSPPPTAKLQFYEVKYQFTTVLNEKFVKTYQTHQPDFDLRRELHYSSWISADLDKEEHPKKYQTKYIVDFQCISKKEITYD